MSEYGAGGISEAGGTDHGTHPASRKRPRIIIPKGRDPSALAVPELRPPLLGERTGLDQVWTAEAYGSDAWTPLAWWGSRTSRVQLGTAVSQLSARPPVTLAMTAMTMDHLTQGRVLLGIGTSNPQVVEGWYGQQTSATIDVVGGPLAIIVDDDAERAADLVRPTLALYRPCSPPSRPTATRATWGGSRT